ncbi:iron-containing alcohol dehydrogenase [Solimonas sp. K1W22B-7]|uniref:iron-containing alcohol dehydrogenase PsrA n=1 Tax=Solimonas sp. K1W22B-7 TaxID=2303331 RepID=UPI000E335EF9|nr:iron-containing alcohol dehydrogenase PsrA [Solimonas sp. K1W22B-7]AXQ28916.1 iron-containing alcohol dehydrogenase [Solimonas sp. K1W22B-7]
MGTLSTTPALSGELAQRLRLPATAWLPAQPVPVRFGAGVFAELGQQLRGRPYVLLTYPQPRFTALARRLAVGAGQPRQLLDTVRPNPTLADLETLAAPLRGLGGPTPVLVALGGGSVIDSAKVVAALAAAPGLELRALLAQPAAAAARAWPVIAVPTTAGTGSEVTPWATVWDPANDRKHSLSRPDLFPELALVDPELTLGAPRGLTLQTGLDALSHALESLWNRNAGPCSSVLAVAAARRVLETLPRLLENPGDLELRTRQAEASLLAGLAFAQTRTALAHELSYPLTLRHGVPHGIACSFTLPQIMQAVIGADADCDHALAEIFGADLQAGVATLRRFLRDLGVGLSPADYGVAEDEWHAIQEAAGQGPRGRNFLAASAADLSFFPNTDPTT